MKRIKTELEPVGILEEEPEYINRVHPKRILEMIKYLNESGYKIEAWKRVDKPHWKIVSKTWSWTCRSHLEAYNYLFPFVAEQRKKDYSDYMQERAERYRREMKLNEKTIHATKLL